MREYKGYEAKEVKGMRDRHLLLVSALCVVIGMLIYAAWDIEDARTRKQAALDAAQLAPADQIISENNERTGNKIGDLAPNVRLPNLQDESVSLADYRGKIVLVNFWASWCPPCQEELPDLQRIYEEYEGQVIVLAINLTKAEATVDDVRAFVEESDVTFPIVLDHAGDAMNAYRIVAYPSTYVVDEAGVIRERFLGAVSYDTLVDTIGKM
jgi:peroxiredoxin